MLPDCGPRESPRVAVIILNWNNWQETIRAAESVLRNDYQNFRVIIADNASTDGSVGQIKSWATGKVRAEVDQGDVLSGMFLPPTPKPVEYAEVDRCETGAGFPDVPLTILHTGDNQGYAGGNNAAIEYVLARDPDSYVLVLGNDAAMSGDFLKRAVRRAEEDPVEASVYGFSQHYYYEPELPFSSYMTEKFSVGPVHMTASPQESRKTIYNVLAYGGALLISPRSPVKLFPEEYFLYCEDSDFCRQVEARGGTVAVNLDLPIYEKGSSSVGRGSALQIYYTRRNKLAYSRKFNSKLEYSIIVLRVTLSTIRGSLKSLLDRDPERTKAYLLAYLHHFQGKMGKRWPQD